MGQTLFSVSNLIGIQKRGTSFRAVRTLKPHERVCDTKVRQTWFTCKFFSDWLVTLENCLSSLNFNVFINKIERSNNSIAYVIE